MHPIFDAPALISQTEENFDAWLVSQNPIPDPSELDVSLLRVVVAIGECVNSMGPNDFCRQLISSAEAEASKSYMNSVLTCRDAVVLTTLVRGSSSSCDKKYANANGRAYITSTLTKSFWHGVE